MRLHFLIYFLLFVFISCNQSTPNQVEKKSSSSIKEKATPKPRKYSGFYGTDGDVENFMKRVQSSILSEDKEWIAEHTRFPIKTKLNSKKKISIKNKQELISNFNKIFNQEFKNKIKVSSTTDLFHTYQGVMLGDGEIWIDNKPDSTEKEYPYFIIAINN